VFYLPQRGGKQITASSVYANSVVSVLLLFELAFLFFFLTIKCLLNIRILWIVVEYFSDILPSTVKHLLVREKIVECNSNDMLTYVSATHNTCGCIILGL